MEEELGQKWLIHNNEWGDYEIKIIGPRLLSITANSVNEKFV